MTPSDGDDGPTTIHVEGQPGATTVVEHAVLDVSGGRETEFEEAFATAKAHIASAAGFRWLRLSRGLERPDRYLLLVGWDSLEDHTEGFRGSPAYEEWRRLLHHFYDPFPVVEHFTSVAAVDRPHPSSAP